MKKINKIKYAISAPTICGVIVSACSIGLTSCGSIVSSINIDEAQATHTGYFGAAGSVHIFDATVTMKDGTTNNNVDWHICDANGNEDEAHTNVPLGFVLINGSGDVVWNQGATVRSYSFYAKAVSKDDKKISKISNDEFTLVIDPARVTSIVINNPNSRLDINNAWAGVAGTAAEKFDITLNGEGSYDTEVRWTFLNGVPAYVHIDESTGVISWTNLAPVTPAIRPLWRVRVSSVSNEDVYADGTFSINFKTGSVVSVVVDEPSVMVASGVKDTAGVMTSDGSTDLFFDAIVNTVGVFTGDSSVTWTLVPNDGQDPLPEWINITPSESTTQAQITWTDDADVGVYSFYVVATSVADVNEFGQSIDPVTLTISSDEHITSATLELQESIIGTINESYSGDDNVVNTTFYGTSDPDSIDFTVLYSLVDPDTKNPIDSSLISINVDPSDKSKAYIQWSAQTAKSIHFLVKVVITNTESETSPVVVAYSNHSDLHICNPIPNNCLDIEEVTITIDDQPETVNKLNGFVIGANISHDYDTLLVPSNVYIVAENAFGFDSGSSKQVPECLGSNGWIKNLIFDTDKSGSPLHKGCGIIDTAAFCETQSIEFVDLSSELKEVGWQAFYKSTGIEHVDFSNATQLATIMSQAFQGCSNLIEAILPDSQIHVMDYVFKDCTSLVKVHLPETNKDSNINTALFYNCVNLEDVNVPKHTKRVFTNAFSNTGVSIFDLSQTNITQIDAGAFSDNSSLIKIVLPGTVTSIGGRAFGDCNVLALIEYDSLDATSVQYSGVNPYINCVASGVLRVHSEAVGYDTFVLEKFLPGWTMETF